MACESAALCDRSDNKTLNGVFLAGDDALLRAVIQAGAAADTGVSDAIAFFFHRTQTDGIGFSEDGVHA